MTFWYQINPKAKSNFRQQKNLEHHRKSKGATRKFEDFINCLPPCDKAAAGKAREPAVTISPRERKDIPNLYLNACIK